MAIPTLDSSAVSVAGTGTSLDVPFPGTVNSGDFLLLTYGVSSATGASLPSGWALKKTASNSTCTAELYTKIASGSESGNLTFTVGEDGLPKIARIYRSTDADDLETIDSSGASGKIINHAAVVSTTTDRLGITLTAINDNETAASFTGESNGDLTLLVADTTPLGTDHALSVQTADMATAVTLSGGTWSFSGANENWVTLVWAIFKTGALTQKSLSVTFTTAMASTVIPTHVQLSNVTFNTAMTIASKVINTSLAFALGTAFTLTKKVSVSKTVSFITSTSLAASLLAVRSFSVSFVTTMALSTIKTITKAISVSFATTMSLATRFISAVGGGVFGAWTFLRRRRGKRWR